MQTVYSKNLQLTLQTRCAQQQAQVMSQRYCRVTPSQHTGKHDLLQDRVSLVPPQLELPVGSQGPGAGWQQAESRAGCVAVEGSVQPVAIIGHAGSTDTELQSAAEELLQNQK